LDSATQARRGTPPRDLGLLLALSLASSLDSDRGSQVTSQQVQRTGPKAVALTHTSVNIPIAGPDESASAVWGRLIGSDRFDSATDIAVLEEDSLAGLVRIEDLIAASPETRLRDLMDPEPPIIDASVDQEQAAASVALQGQRSLAVIDANGRFMGLIPAHRMLSVALDEHSEDLARLSGYLHDADRARVASREGLALRFWHRAPWLLLGLAAAMAAAIIVAQFEQNLESNLALAFFIPSIVYIADAVGTQTETLVVRGLSLGVSVRNVARKEVLTGLALGLALAILAWPAVAIWQGPAVGFVVATSVLIACTLASGVAMALPWAFSAFGLDPAFGSGPLATVIQDLLSLVIYFAVAAVIL
jgi:magnesium transporter